MTVLSASLEHCLAAALLIGIAALQCCWLLAARADTPGALQHFQGPQEEVGPGHGAGNP